MVNLFYSVIDGPGKHPQDKMNELGISYTLAVPQSIADGWQFFHCRNIPETLPSYLRIMKPVTDYSKYIGYGLSSDEASALNKELL